MINLSETNRKIVDAVVKKCERDCPGVLALISVHGSVLTGDTHEGSDLDLNILINEEYNDRIASCFILDDTGVGYDLYCTSWKRLEEDALCKNPHLSKLLDGEILYAADENAKARYLMLRKKAVDYLSGPFSENDLEIAESHLSVLKDGYFNAMVASDIADSRAAAAEVIQEAVETVMAVNKRYFKLGVKRTFEEMRMLDLPSDFEETILTVVRETDAERLKAGLTKLCESLNRFLEKYRKLTAKEKLKPDAGNLTGTYEEMISNWHKKVREAAKCGDVYSAFMAVASMNYMRNAEIGAEVDIDEENVMACFDPSDLNGTFECFEKALENYRKEYDKIGLPVRRYRDVDAFVEDYLKS